MGMIMKGLTYDYGGAEPFFHLLERTLSEHDKLYTKESPSHTVFIKTTFYQRRSLFKNLTVQSVDFFWKQVQ